jgi:hypothetical protein
MINSSAYRHDGSGKAESDGTFSDILEVMKLMKIASPVNSMTSTTINNDDSAKTNTNPIIYSNRGENIDLCVSCYSKSSDTLKNKLKLSPGYKRSGSDYYWCDVCKANIFVGDGPETKLQVLLKLKDLNLSVENLINSCQSNPWNNRIDALYSELIVGGMTESMAREIRQKLV